MRSLKIDKLLLFVLLVPTVSSLIISSVYAGKKKFKTFSFGNPLLPAIVKVQPHRFHLTFRQSKYLKTPEFKIEGTLPLKAPTILKEIINPDPEPEVTEYNIGNVLTSHEEPIYAASNQHQSITPINALHTSRNPQLLHPSIPSPHQPMIPPNNERMFVDRPNIEHSNFFNVHHQMRRSANNYNNQFHSQNPYFNGNYGQNFQMSAQTPQNDNNYEGFDSNINQQQQQYRFPPNDQSFFNPNIAHNQPNAKYESTHFNNYRFPHIQNQNSDNMHQSYQNNAGIHASSSSFTPQKYKKVFVPANPQNTKWTPITNGHNNYLQLPNNPNMNSAHSSNRIPVGLPNYENSAEASSKKVNIGEHYNPSASYVDEQVVTKPTYDPDEGSISFSISGPHGGEKVPFGYEAAVKEHQEQLKKYPDHIPPGFDMQDLLKYYNRHTFTDTLKDDYGLVAATGPFSFIKSKLSSLKKLI